MIILTITQSIFYLPTTALKSEYLHASVCVSVRVSVCVHACVQAPLLVQWLLLCPMA